MKKGFLLFLIFMGCLYVSPVKSLSPVQNNGRYLSAGIENDHEFERWFRTLQKYIKADNREKVIACIHFPLDVRINHQWGRLQNKKDLLKNYNELFTKEFKEVIINQRISELKVNDQGVMVGSGQMWINVLEGKPGFWITALNN